ncbi:YybS family protein [Bacillus norwichensis]|uniref:YybS family protein n=1 Tax=Bacillus norwichensis TaxID=2762217 RepID=A0ABR8VME8_9BACI|nr:YybS family protein [Bacillus norwichensis]MBD8005601.1 YybS family protein [Bacillus norwichensis]
MKNTRMLTEGALMLAIFTVLLLFSAYVPMAMLATQFFLILPFLFYSSKYPLKNSLVLLIGAMFMSMLAGTVLAIPFTILYGTTGIMMGYCIRTGKTKMVTYMASNLVFLGNVVLFYVLAAQLFGMNFFDKMIQIFLRSSDQYADMMRALGQTPDPNLQKQVQDMIGLMKTLAPSLLVSSAFLYVILFIVINFPIIKRFGIDVPKFPPFRTVKFPKSILWYYLITLMVSLFIKPAEGTFLHMTVVNAAYILQILMMIQGLAFIYYYSHVKKWSKAIPVTATVMTFLLPTFFSIIRLLGIIDLGFDLRQRLAKK